MGDEVGKDYEDEIEEEEKIKAKENRQRENQEQFQKDKLDTYQKRNEIEQQMLQELKRYNDNHKQTKSNNESDYED